MRKVTYVNELGKSITFDDTLPNLLVDIDTSSLGITEQIYKSIEHDGQKAGEITLNARTIICEFVVAFMGTAENYRKKWREICDIFSPKLKGTLHYSNSGGSYKIDCRPLEVPKNPKEQKFTIQFIADNPYWQNADGYYKRLGTVQGGLSFPIKFNPKIKFGIWTKQAIIKNNTSEEAPFIISVESVSDYCQITNQKGEFLRIDRVIAEGERLEIDTGNYTVKLFSPDGSFIYSNNKLTLDSTYFKLYQGENILDFDNGSSSFAIASISYNDLYLGV